MSAHASVVIIEGVGAARREVSRLLDAVVWVQSDFREAERRATVRNGGDAAAMEQTRDTEEIPFLAADRPWERATIIVAGTPDHTHDPIGNVVIAPPLPRRVHGSPAAWPRSETGPRSARSRQARCIHPGA